MYTFVVLGLIPGTNIQLTFDMWLQIISSLAVATLVIWSAGSFLKFYRYTNELLMNHLRTPLHATQLHQRVR
jgi:hypothetical protein